MSTSTPDFRSDIRALTVPWTESPFFTDLLASAKLTAEEKQLVTQFAAQGYLIIDPQVEEGLLDTIIKELEGKYNHTPTGHAEPDRVQDAWQFCPAVKQLVAAPRILQVLELLYQRKPLPFQTLNFMKGTEQMTHSDTIHFQSYPSNFMCGVWVALEDIDERNGALHYYPGSHKTPLYDMGTLGIPAAHENYVQYEKFVKAFMEASGFERQIVNMKKGEALIWAANLYHGGIPILDRERTRLSQVTHYYFEDCMYYTPIRSELFLRDIFFRAQLSNILTGERLRHVYKGHQVDAWAGSSPGVGRLRKLVPPALARRIAKLKNRK